MPERLRIYATCDVGDEALQRLRDKGWDLEVYDKFDPPPRELVMEKVKSGIAALITTLRDKVDDELLAAGKAAGLRTRRTGTSVALLGTESANGDVPDGERRPANLEDLFVLLTGEEIE